MAEPDPANPGSPDEPGSLGDTGSPGEPSDPQPQHALRKPEPFRGSVRVSVALLIAGVIVYAARLAVGTVAQLAIDRGEDPGAIGLAHDILQLATIALGLTLLTIGLLLVDTRRRVLGVVCVLAGLVGGQQLCVMFW